jgi:hypothetical protein
MLAVYADNYSYESIPENIKNEYKSVLDSLMVE